MSEQVERPCDPQRGYRFSLEDIRHFRLPTCEEEIAAQRIKELEDALRDLVMLERQHAPDMGGKRRVYAFMQNGKVLADCLDHARALLPESAR